MSISSPLPFLPYGRHLIEDDDIAAITSVLRGDWLTTGPSVSAFENALAQQTMSPHAVVCSNGTTALHLSTWALGLGEGDAAIVPTLTFLATANCVRYVGAEVVFADVDPDTGLLTPETLEAALCDANRRGLKVRAVLPVHLAGQMADMQTINAISRAHNLKIIEDCCHALGGAYASENGEHVPVGSNRYGDLSIFSFHPVKTITSGEGGAITTQDPILAEKLRSLRSHGMVRSATHFTCPEQAFDSDGVPNPWYYEMPELGQNFRLSDINCALGLSQLGKLERFIKRRQVLSDRYDRFLAPLAPIIHPLKRMPGHPAWHLYAVLIDFATLGLSRATVMASLKDRGIGTQVHYLPVHRQPYYRSRYGNIALPGADSYYDRCLSLPLYPGMDDTDVDRVVDALSTLVAAYRR